MSNLGPKIIEGLKQAVAGDLARVTIEGETWARVKDIHADQHEIMRINNELRLALLATRPFILAAPQKPGTQDMIARIDALVW